MDDEMNEPQEVSPKYTICVHVCHQDEAKSRETTDVAEETADDDNDDEMEEDSMDNVVEHSFHTYAWTTVKEMKKLIEQEVKIDACDQRLFHHGVELLKNRTLSSHRIGDGSRLWLQIVKADQNCPIVPYGTGYSKRCRQMIGASISGFERNDWKEGIEEGEGGSYFLRSAQGSRVAVFKPFDEETGAVNNPKGNTVATLRAGIHAETGHMREVAAYLMDRQHFHGVPPTVRCEVVWRKDGEEGSCPKVKIGSLQKFVKSVDVAGNMGPAAFSVREVHKIGILDIRILNNDRNEANILVQQDEYRRYELIPIDHGLSIPEKIEISDIDWIWWKWPQAKEPFEPYTKQVIREIDIDGQINMLRDELGISERALDNLRIAHMVLVEGMESGLNLYDIANIILRKSFTEPSILENLCEQAELLAQQTLRQAKYSGKRERVSSASRPNASRKSPRGRPNPQTLPNSMLPRSGTPNFPPLTAPHGRTMQQLNTNHPAMPSFSLSGGQSSSPPPPLLNPIALGRSSTDPSSGTGIARNIRSLSVNASPERGRFFSPTMRAIRVNKSKSPMGRGQPPAQLVSAGSSASPILGGFGPALSILDSVRPPHRVDEDDERESHGELNVLPQAQVRDPDELFMGRLMIVTSDLGGDDSPGGGLLPTFVSADGGGDDDSDDEDGDDDDDDLPGGPQRMERSISCVDLHNTGLSSWRANLVMAEEERALTDDSFSAFGAERYSMWNRSLNGSHLDLLGAGEEIGGGVSFGGSSPRSSGGDAHGGNNGIGEIIARVDAENTELKKYFFERLQQSIKMFCETHTRTANPESSIFDTDTAVGHFVWLNEQRKYLEGRNVFAAKRRLREEEARKEAELIDETNPFKDSFLF